MNTQTPSRFNLLSQLGFALLLLLPLAVGAAGVPPASGNTYWIANEGQWEGDFQFKCEVGSTVYYVTPKGMTVDFREFKRYPKPRDPRDPLDMMDRHEDHDSVTVRGHVVQIHYSGLPQNPSADLGGLRGASGENKLPHYSNYFFGRDSTKWRSRVGHFQTVLVEEVWEGIDVEYRADQLGVETIYRVKPGADPTQIQMEYLGLEAPLRIDAQGNLVLATSLDEVKEKAPYAYQQVSRTQRGVESSYRIAGDNRVVFTLDLYDLSQELVIDPVLYGTFLGTPNIDYVRNIASDGSGGVYVEGKTYAWGGPGGFPTTPGAYDETGLYSGVRLFCSHIGADGTFLASTLFGEVQTPQDPNTRGFIYDLTYLPGSGVWMCGYTDQPGWPLTPDALDTTHESIEAIVLSLSADLTTLNYCSYLGGPGGEQARFIAPDSAGRLCVVGDNGGGVSVDAGCAADRTSGGGGTGSCGCLIRPPGRSAIPRSSGGGGERHH